MKKTKKETIILTTSLAIVTAATTSYFLIDTNLYRELTAYDCSMDATRSNPISNIIQSGPEYIIINPDQSWGRNSFLVSKELQDTPTNWRYLGLETVTSTWGGFSLEPKKTKQKPIIQNISFDTRTRELQIGYNKSAGGYKPDDINVKCKENNNIIIKAKETANNIPATYLLGRQTGIAFLRPSLTNKEFNRLINSDISSKDHSEYGQYQLLAYLGNNQRDSEEENIYNSLKQTLINRNTNNTSIWEFIGTYRYWWERQYANEKAEAEKNARNWCRNQQYDSKDTYLNQGYKVTSDNPDKKSTNGWAKQTYTDGRFSGYVKYKAECDGRYYTLKKDGTVDDHSENTYGGGR